MYKDIARYICNCHHCHRCQRSQTWWQRSTKILSSLSVLSKPCTIILMDFIIGLLWFEGYDVIWVVVDWLTKMQHFVPCWTPPSASHLADMFLQHIWWLYGLSDTIISDRRTQSASGFWQQLCTTLGIQLWLSTAFYSETDGQMEHVNAVLKQYLRAYVFHQ
jgi:hypothetical protein